MSEITREIKSHKKLLKRWKRSLKEHQASKHKYDTSDELAVLMYNSKIKYIYTMIVNIKKDIKQLKMERKFEIKEWIINGFKTKNKKDRT